MEITYVRATRDDVSDFFSFFKMSIRSLFPEYTVMTREYFIDKDYSESWARKVVESKNKIIFLAKAENKIIGYLFVDKVYGGVGRVDWIAVAPEYQKHGIATELIHKWIDYCKENKAHALQLCTTDKNVQFYTKLGFTCAGTFKKGWFGVDMFFMYQTLGEPNDQDYLKEYLANKKD